MAVIRCRRRSRFRPESRGSLRILHCQSLLGAESQKNTSPSPPSHYIGSFHIQHTNIFAEAVAVSNSKWCQQSRNYLNARLVELCYPGQFLPAVDIGIVRLGEGGLEFLQLFLREGGAMSSSRRCRWTSGRRSARTRRPSSRAATRHRSLIRVVRRQQALLVHVVAAAQMSAQAGLHFQLLKCALHRTRDCRDSERQNGIS